MRRFVLSVLLVASLSSGLTLPAPAPDPDFPDNDTDNPTECNLIRKAFCSKANWMSENNLLRTWEVVPDEIGQDGDLREHLDEDQFFKDPWISDQWQFQPAQTSSTHYDGFDEGYNPESLRLNDPDLPGLMVIYLQNKDVLIENDKAFFVYDTLLASTNPFDMQRVSLTCFHKFMKHTTSNDRLPPDDNKIQDGENDIYKKDTIVNLENVIPKRQESEIGQKEIPDTLIFNEENGDIKKKLFSFWSRLQGLSPRAHALHAVVYYGPDGARAGPLSAEPRVAHLRPPGQPLRWG